MHLLYQHELELCIIIYLNLIATYTPGHWYLSMDNTVDTIAHIYLQKDGDLQQQKAEHPSFAKDILWMFNGKDGRKLRKYAKGRVFGHGSHQQPIINKQLKVYANTKRLPFPSQ